jgi:hypothetical protein
MNPLLQSLVDSKPSESLAGDSPLVAKPGPIQKLRYSHEAMIDLLISQPWISQNALADHFGMSASWVSTIICSDLFQSKLAERRDQLVDPELRLSIKAQMEGLHSRSMDILRRKLEKSPEEIPDQLALQVAKVMGQGLGYGGNESRVSVQETHIHLEQLGENLVGLLRRRKAVAAEEYVDAEVSSVGAESRPRSNGNGSLPSDQGPSPQLPARGSE